MARRSKKGTTGWDRAAESLGTVLGQVAKRVDTWKQQRTELTADIQKVLSSAQGLLGELGVRDTGSRRRGGRPKGYKLSDETKRKLRLAWKRRKAVLAAAKAKSGE